MCLHSVVWRERKSFTLSVFSSCLTLCSRGGFCLSLCFGFWGAELIITPVENQTQTYMFVLQTDAI